MKLIQTIVYLFYVCNIPYIVISVLMYSSYKQCLTFMLKTAITVYFNNVPFFFSYVYRMTLCEFACR